MQKRLAEVVDQALTEAQQRTGLTRETILYDAEIEPSQIRLGLSGKRPFSHSLLQKLADCEHIQTPAVEFLAYKLLEEYPDAAIRRAAEILDERTPG